MTADTNRNATYELTWGNILLATALALGGFYLFYLALYAESHLGELGYGILAFLFIGAAFAGFGGMFMRKKSEAEPETYSDYNPESYDFHVQKDQDGILIEGVKYHLIQQ